MSVKLRDLSTTKQKFFQVNQQISAKQKADYFCDGYLIIKDFASSLECLTLKQVIQPYLKQGEAEDVIFSTQDQCHCEEQYFLESGNQIRCFYEQNKRQEDKTRAINKVGHALHAQDAVFKRWSTSPNIARLAYDLGMKQPALIQSMYILKQPFVGGAVTCHQDAAFLHSSPITVTGFWLALEDASVENGCLYAIPGGHQSELSQRLIRRGNKKVHMQDLAENEWNIKEAIPLEVKQGTLIVLHGLLPHYSPANHSSASRHAYAIHAVDLTSDFSNDNWLQDPCIERLGHC
ncbi:phytanoyl-CoA dioxygenase family protein [Zooshikella harenae]|uniref:Phytanoyl-CoA dioxygenase family protein n=1 Tax=Zooshikella harenae TaxID=2827238 RepID=A0ABS5ZGX7_9GAMM|nr:phytanoyl-CoA dioxygenase family protein [Zooshikella harenae]MBU2713316.1 phytanoyl-CoA dioxygenase family protein [Zooshikella harenae]